VPDRGVLLVDIWQGIMSIKQNHQLGQLAFKINKIWEKDEKMDGFATHEELLD
jgi:hypothetical protein